MSAMLGLSGPIAEANIAQDAITLMQHKNKKDNRQVLLTRVCTATALAGVTLLQEVNSKEVQEAMFAQFFIPNRFPSVRLVDKGSKFKGHLIQCIEFLEIPFEVLSPKEHQGIYFKQLHHYLNKEVQYSSTEGTDGILYRKKF
jgi:hypothetical protein